MTRKIVSWFPPHQAHFANSNFSYTTLPNVWHFTNQVMYAVVAGSWKGIEHYLIYSVNCGGMNSLTNM